MPPAHVLFVCTGNAGRSQIAEALFRQSAGDKAHVCSAGVDPWSDLHPLAVELLQARSIDTHAQKPKHVRTMKAAAFDFVVTIGGPARAGTPDLPGNPRRIHWDIPDPAEEPENGQQAAFARVAAEIERRLPDLLRAVDEWPRASQLHLAPGISTCCVRPLRFEPERDLPLIAKAGFRCIELNCYLGSDDFPWDRPARVDDLARIARQTGVAIYSVHAPGYIYATPRDAWRRSADLQLAKAFADVASQIGALVVAIHVGLPPGCHAQGAAVGPFVRAAQGRGSPAARTHKRQPTPLERATRDPTAEARNRLREILEELEEYVLPLPCRFGWENEAAGLSPEEHLAMIETLNPGAFGFILDTGHAHIDRATDAYLSACGRRLCDLHLDDNRGDADSHYVPGEGTFPWAGFLAKLEACGYTGPLMLEIQYTDRKDGLSAILADAAASLHKVVAPA